MSRHNPAYMSTSNMSDIKQSIEQYSMNFENSQEAISEMISMSRTGKNVSMSKNSKVPNLKKSGVNTNKQQQKFHRPDMKYTQEHIVEQQVAEDKQNSRVLQKNDKNNDPVFLGDNVYNCVRERHRQLQGTQTYDPDVLFEFYKRQRKNYKPQNKNVTLYDLGVLMPSSQRKMLLRIEFQKILTYYPNDVYYTLACGAQKYKKDQQLNNKINRFDQMMKKPEPKKKKLKQVVERLYGPQKSQVNTKQADERQKRKIFGNRLRQVYQNHFRNNPNPPLETAEKMYDFWEDMYQRDQYGIQWNQDTVKEDIRQYMMEQVEDLQNFLEKKLGFRQLKGQQLYKFYVKYKPIEGINIPLASFKQYLKAFNQINKQRAQKQIQEQRKRNQKNEQSKKERQVRKFGRPVSATPISVLSKPKKSANFGELAQKYSTDKFLNTILHADKMKIVRHAFQYGIHNLEQEVKTKGRVKPNSKQLYQKTIFKMLNNTFSNKNFFNVKEEDRVRDILGQEDIQKDEHWKELGPVLQQAMLVKAYQHMWFRDALLKYCSKTIAKDLKYSDDKTVVQQLIQYFDNLSQYNRRQQIQNLQNVINTSETIAERTEQIKKLSEKGENVERKQKKLFYSYLQEKACEFVDMRVKRKQINLRKFLNQIFETGMKEHKDFVTKHFHVVTGQKQCPKLLRYEFYRLQKQINPFTKQRDEISKCHAWIPTKSTPQNFNYKTFNTYANAYLKDKSKIVSKPETQEFQHSIWSYKKDRVKQRQALMISYDDAKQCVFHPRISQMK